MIIEKYNLFLFLPSFLCKKKKSDLLGIYNNKKNIFFLHEK